MSRRSVRQSQRVSENYRSVILGSGYARQRQIVEDVRTRSRSIPEVSTDPPMPPGVVQCQHCKMRFNDIAGAQTKHDRHQPDCSMFDRSNQWNDTESLRFCAMIAWIKTLKVAQLKEQLKLYHNKTSGNKVMIIIIVESSVTTNTLYTP